jgi:hypothetical protein
MFLYLFAVILVIVLPICHSEYLFVSHDLLMSGNSLPFGFLLDGIA